MSDFGEQGGPTPLFVHTFGLQSIAPTLSRFVGINAATITWVANQAVFVPVSLPWWYPVRRVFWANGSTVTTTNIDFGIYTTDGTRLYSTGSTVQAGASALQYVSPTPFWLPPGSYYFAWNCSQTTSRAFGTVAATAAFQRQCGILQQAVGAIALPATMASAGAATQAVYPFCGVTRTASGF